MQTTTIVVFSCVIACVVAHAHYEHYPAVDAVQEAVYDTPAHDRSPRTKRSLLLLKKKLILGKLGILGLKAAKVGAVGAKVAKVAGVGIAGAGIAGAGIAGVFALKSKTSHDHPPSYVEVYSHPQPYIDPFYGWSG